MNRDNFEKSGKESLTGIHPPYTMYRTTEPDTNGTEGLIVKHFLDTLAEVSLSIASRMEKSE